MGPDELDMKIEVKRLSRESRRQAEGWKKEKEKDREKRQTDRATDVVSREEGGQRKTEKSSFSVATLASSALQILQSLANVAPEHRSSFICLILSVPRLIFPFFSPFTTPYFFPSSGLHKMSS